MPISLSGPGPGRPFHLLQARRKPPPRTRIFGGWTRAVLLALAASLLLPPTLAFAEQPTVWLWATREGLVGQTTANGHVIQERDRFVALPSRKALNARGRRDYMVRIEYKGRVTEAPVWDVGPWNIDDDFWNERRERFADLPRWTSQAEAAFFQGYNGGRDGFGRYITIPTSIDLADGTFWDDLGMTNNDWVKVTFLWLDAPSPPPKATPVVVPKRAPDTAPPVVFAPPPPAPSGNATLTASPNPVPAGLGRGSTTISWDTGDNSFGRVYVWQNGGAEALFAEGAKGSAPAPWILPGYTYEFRLYRGTTRTERLRTLIVNGTTARPVIEPAPPPASSIQTAFAEEPGGDDATPADASLPGAEEVRPETAMAEPPASSGPWISAEIQPARGVVINWDTGTGDPGRVYVWQQGGAEVLFAEGANGSALAPWVQTGWTYEFRLYRAAERGERLGAITVTGPPGFPLRLAETTDAASPTSSAMDSLPDRSAGEWGEVAQAEAAPIPRPLDG